MTKPIVWCDKGDLVEFKIVGGFSIGIVMGDDHDWWCIKNHLDISHRIVDRRQVTRVLQHQVIAPRLIHYLHAPLKVKFPT